MSANISLLIPLNPEDEGRVAHACALLGCTPDKLVLGAFAYALAKVGTNMPLKDSMQASLQANEATNLILRSRIQSAIHTAEKALADNIAITRTIAAIANSDTPVESATEKGY